MGWDAGSALMTTTRSLMAMASSRSWVMNSTALRLACQSQQHLVFHQLAGLDVQGRERLVHQDDVGVQYQCLCQTGALAHAAAHLVRVAVAETCEAHTGKPVLGLQWLPSKACRETPAQPSRWPTLCARASGFRPGTCTRHADFKRRSASPNTATFPALGVRSPAATLSRVLFPHPCGPTTRRFTRADVQIHVFNCGIALARASLLTKVQATPESVRADACADSAAAVHVSRACGHGLSTNSLV